VADSFNPYLTWLNIKTAASPPDHYALLGIAPFESDQQVVSTTAGAQLAKVRGIRPGSRLTEWQRVIDELTSAKNCLCDSTAKAAYDKSLRERLARGDSPASATADSVIKFARPKSDPSKNELVDTKSADPDGAGRNVLPPSKSNIGTQVAEGAGAKSPARALNPLPPTNAARTDKPKTPPSGSGIAEAASASSAQGPANPALRLPLPSAIPTTAMPAASAAGGPQRAVPFAPAGVPIQPLPMPGAALPQQPVVPGLRPSVPLPTPTTSGAATGTAAILLADSAAPATRQTADQPSRPSPALSSLEQLGIGGQPEYRRTTGPQRRSSMVPLIAVGIAAAAAVTVGLIIANKTRVGADLIAGGGGGSSTSSSKDGAGKTSAASAAPSSTATTATDKSADPPKLRQDSSGTQNNQKPTGPTATDPPTRALPPNDPHPAATPEPRPSRPFNPLLDQAPSDVEPPKPAPVEPPKVGSTKAMPNTVKPLPEGPVDPAQAAKLSQTLAEARTKLAQRQPAEARKLIETAAQLATTQEQRDKVGRMDALEKYVDGFWSAVHEAINALKPLDEIEVGSLRVIVVDVNATTLTIKHEGRITKSSTDKLPAITAVALAERSLDMTRPENKVYIGAFYLVDNPKTGSASAKAYWDEAATAGVDVSNLLPLLKPDEPLPPDAPIVNAPKPGAIKPAERKTAPPKPGLEQPITANSDKVKPAATAAPLSVVPSNDLIDKVEKQLQADLGSEFADAATPQKKAELAKKLIEQAASDHDLVRRFVMWRDARDLAADAGQPAVMIQAVDQMAAQFRIDPIDMKADALAASPPKDGPTGRAYAEAALKLADEALAAGRQALAGRYSQIALSAARTANSVELIRKAQKKAKEIQDAAKTDSGM
jgi:hypothetical protein